MYTFLGDWPFIYEQVYSIYIASDRVTTKLAQNQLSGPANLVRFRDLENVRFRSIPVPLEILLSAKGHWLLSETPTPYSSTSRGT